MMDHTALRARFHALGKLRMEVEAKSAPIRSRYNDLQEQSEALRLRMRPLIEEMKEIERPLFDIDQERSMITRALGGRTGEAS